MKLYLLAVHSTEAQPPRPLAQRRRALEQVDALNAELRQAGVWVFAGGLLPTDSATVVRLERGAVTMTDGPFAETKEQLGGFWILRCADLDEVLAWAAKCSQACQEPVEVRPFADGSDT